MALMWIILKKSNSDQIKSGIPSSMRTCHKYNICCFDTIDHDDDFCILEKYGGICGNALKLIKSYFSDRIQLVKIGNVLSDFANMVSSGLCFGPFVMCLYLLRLNDELMYHQIYYNYNYTCPPKQPLEEVTKTVVFLTLGKEWLLIN